MGQDAGRRFDRWTNRQTSRAWRRLGFGHFVASFIAAAKKLLVACCNLQLHAKVLTFNFYHSCDRRFRHINKLSMLRGFRSSKLHQCIAASVQYRKTIAFDRKSTLNHGAEFTGPENDGLNRRARKCKTKSLACIDAFSSPAI